MSAEATAAEPVYFGKWKIDPREVFLETKLSRGIVNMKPVVPGHVLVISKRVVPRFADLTPEETSDLWITAQRVGQKIEPFFGASSLTFAIQDGADAGQTVAHVHIHILPRKKGDFKNNDDVYTEIEKNEQDIDYGREKQRMDESEERKPRTMEEMGEEAEKLRALMG